MHIDLSQKVALVTGASRGIGAEIARQLASCNALVIGTATTLSGAEKIAAELQTIAAHNSAMVLDVNCADSRREVVAAIAKQHRGVDILVNNAGVASDNILLRMRDEQWQRVIDTNLSAVYAMSKLCLRHMLKAKAGRIINISSVVALSGNSGQTNYAAAKAGLIGFTKSLAQEIGSRNITVNAIAPGYIETDMTAGLDAKTRATISEQIALKRWGKPADIANMVCFLSAATGAYITGETINISGGLYM